MHARAVTTTPDLARTQAWFERAGFRRVSDSPVVYSDGGASLEVAESRSMRPGLRLYGVEDPTVLAPFGPMHAFDGGRMIAEPSGVWIYLMDGEPPSGAPIATEPDAKQDPALLGKFAGISLESARIVESTRFWEALGFERTAGDPEQGWLTVTGADAVTISLMKPFVCPHTVTNPSFTYFNSGGNPAIIAELRRREVPIYEEITAFNSEGVVDNVILREPGGWGFFVFND